MILLYIQLQKLCANLVPHQVRYNLHTYKIDIIGVLVLLLYCCCKELDVRQPGPSPHKFITIDTRLLYSYIRVLYHHVVVLVLLVVRAQRVW